MRRLGRLDLSCSGNYPLTFPFLSLFTKDSGGRNKMGHSESQARYLLLILASLTHASYFIMMGSRSGFPVMFLAYVLSAFSRALLTGRFSAAHLWKLRANISNQHLCKPLGDLSWQSLSALYKERVLMHGYMHGGESWLGFKGVRS